MTAHGPERVELGTVISARGHRTQTDIPGDFSTAVTLVVAFRFERMSGDLWALNCGIVDSVDGQFFDWVQNTTGGSYLLLHAGATRGNARFVVPFGPRLAVAAFCTSLAAPPSAPKATFEGVVATVFWRGT